MTVLARCLLCYPNYAEPQYAATTTATVTTRTPAYSGGSWQAALPLSNFALGKLYKPARSTDATNASTKFDIDLGENRWIGAVALIRHNLTPVVGTSRVKVTVDDTAGFGSPLNTPAFVNAFQVSRAVGSLPNGWALDTTNAPTQEELQHYRSLACVVVLDQNYFGRYVRVEIDDSTNTLGYVQIGGLFVGPWLQPNMNRAAGAQITWRDPSTLSVGDTGVRSYTVRPRYRQASFVLRSLGTDQALEFPFEMEGRLGIGSRVLFVMDPTSANHMHRWSFLGNLEELSPLEFPYINPTVGDKPIRIVEAL